MAYKQGENREQMTLRPMNLDDYVGEDSVCRVIDAFVNTLDMAALEFKYAKPADRGCSPYDPKMFMKLYIYGYMNRVRSSRRLQAEAGRNVEVMWLLEKLVPDDKTICNFRKDNAKQMKKVFRAFNLLCRKLDLFGKELVAVDGTKMRANANRHSIHSKKGTEKQLSEIEKKITEYMNELERNDEAEKSDEKVNNARVGEILEHLKNKKEALTELLKTIEENDGKEISDVDPDARLMHTNGDGRPLDACYNVQTVVDSKHKLIVDFDVTTCADDKGALPDMTEKAKEFLEVETITATGDTGYYDGEDVEKCEQNGTMTYVAKNRNDNRPAPDEGYNKSRFKYDAENDCYICPSGQILPFKSIQKTTGTLKENKIYCNSKACKKCKNRNKCTTNKRIGRTISRSQHQDALDRNNARMAENHDIFKERKKIVEHPFGTTKAVWGYKQYLCRGKERTTAEQSLTFLAYNLRRVINIFHINGWDLIAAMAG